MHHASWFPCANFLLSFLGELAVLLLAASNQQPIFVFLSPLPRDTVNPLLDATVEPFTAENRHFIPANSHMFINTLARAHNHNPLKTTEQRQKATMEF